MKTTISKFKLYELTVQSPRWQVDYLPQFHEWLTKKKPRDFREDFCGSGKISCEWVKSSPKNQATGLDLDPEVLDYANSVNRSELTPSQQKRVQFLKQDVLKATQQKFDMIGAFNFSYYVFHTRKEMLRYAKAAYQSLKSTGTLFLEVAGGEGFLEPGTEEKKMKIPGVGLISQIWEQHQYDPITHVSDFSIHFKLPKNIVLNDAFTYHWRIWKIRELREILEEAGFKKTVVLWETSDSEFLPLENTEHVHSHVSYVVGVK